MSESIPQSALSEALQRHIKGRRVRVAVFTTFTFDPAFFELHVLPCLFDRPFSQVEKVRRIQLEDALRTLEEAAVYYDRTALAQDAQPAQLDFRRIDVRRKTGVFHPKLALLLLDQPAEPGVAPRQVLLAAVMSANLTRAGWWENVEVCHIEEIPDRDEGAEKCPYRADLLALLRQVRAAGDENENHAGLDRIHEFLIRRATRDAPVQHSARGRYYTRLFMGQSDLPSWLEELGLAKHEWNLEIISPFFDSGEPRALRHLIEVMKPTQVRLFLPEDIDGTAQVDRRFYERVVADQIAKWSSLPDTILRPSGRKATLGAAARRVHAKVYRFWNKSGQEIVLCGSVNLTTAAHSRMGAGNLEAAFLVQQDESTKKLDWWLRPLDGEPKDFAESQPCEDEAASGVPIDLSLQYDWTHGVLSYRLTEAPRGALTIAAVDGDVLFTIQGPQCWNWIQCTSRDAESIRELLPSTSFVEIRHSRGTWRILIREEGMINRPSLLRDLTPEEILLYWSLLTPEQRESFIGEKLQDAALLEGLKITRRKIQLRGETLFDRFAGIFHAFGRLEAHVCRCLKDGESKEAEARMFGAKYDSLPVLLEKVRTPGQPDPVIAYLTCLCALQTRKQLSKEFPDFWRANSTEACRLDEALKCLPSLRQALPLDIGTDRDTFMVWYEQAFMTRAHAIEGGHEAH
ncbi:MAG: hypothetical protein HZA51_12170 [Planctomycetes bacterium]|nr:hypothetical protein [Planctomycetota bacterium]